MKYFLLIIAFLGILTWRECLHASRRSHLIQYYDAEINEILDYTNEVVENCAA